MLCLSASAICLVLTEPNNLPPSPVLALTSTSISSNLAFNALASSISFVYLLQHVYFVVPIVSNYLELLQQHNYFN